MLQIDTLSIFVSPLSFSPSLLASLSEKLSLAVKLLQNSISLFRYTPLRYVHARLHTGSRIALTLTNCHTLCSSRNLNGTIYISENESFSAGRRENFSNEIASEHALFTKPPCHSIFINSFSVILYQSLINHLLLKHLIDNYKLAKPFCRANSLQLSLICMKIETILSIF